MSMGTAPSSVERPRRRHRTEPQKPRELSRQEIDGVIYLNAPHKGGG